MTSNETAFYCGWSLFPLKVTYRHINTKIILVATNQLFQVNGLGGHSLSTYAKFNEKLIFLTPSYAHVRVHVRGVEIIVFRKILRTYLMDGP